MKVSVLKENLSKTLGITSHAVNNRNNLEILSNVLLKTEDGQLKVEATNLEIGITCYIGARIEKEGAITVPAKLFADFVNTIPHQKITLELKEGNTLQLKSDNFNSNIKGLSADDFPIIPEIKKGKKVTFKLADLKEALSLVSFAAATDESRPVLSGVFIKVADGEMTLAATDSYRLAEKKISVKSEDEFQIIIPQRSLNELSRVINEDGDGEIIVSENQIFFGGPGLKFTSRLIEGEFPDYEKIIPTNLETEIALKRDEFLDGVKASSLFSKQGSRSVKFTVSSKEFEISSPESQIGDSLITIGADITGKNGEITFNSSYVLDVLNALKEDSVTFRMNDKVSPGLFKCPKKDDYVYIIMPLRG